jgi:hypothetical protein
MQPGGPVRQPESTLSPQGTMNLATGDIYIKREGCPAYSMSELYPANIQCEVSEENIVNTFQA